MDGRLKFAIRELGVGEYVPGSSATPGWVYNPLPFPGCGDLRVHRPDTPDRWDIIVRHTNFLGKTVLDLGCATGYFSFRAAQSGADSVLGIDHDPKAIEVCRIAAQIFDIENVTFEHREAGVLDGKFDVGFAMAILNWMGKAKAALWLAWAKDNIDMLWVEIPVRGDGRAPARWLRDAPSTRKWLLGYFDNVEAAGESRAPHRGKMRTLFKCS